MDKIKHVPIIGKVLLVFTMFLAVAVAAIIFSTLKMREIDLGYRNSIAHEGSAARILAEAARSLYGIKSAMTDLQISNTDAGNQEATSDLSHQRSAFIDLMAQAEAIAPDWADEIASLKARGTAIIDRTCAKALAMGAAATKPAELIAAQGEHLTSCAPAYPPLIKDVTALAARSVAEQNRHSVVLTDMTASTIMIAFVVMIGGIGLVVGIGIMAIKAWVSRPIKDMASTMRSLAGGDLSEAISGLDRRDEVGSMAQALQVFKETGLKLRQSEADAACVRELADRERAANETKRIETQRQQATVVATIAEGLDRLSKGDLTGRLNDIFAVDYEKLRADFNATANSLQEALGTISEATLGISHGSDQIAHASDNLARRTEQQAASLEETTASLGLIAETVKATAINTGQAAKVAIATRASAETSGDIVTQAVNAMSRIQDSSRQIGNIVGVIDEIAFQTNLLALNAGVEAARAGDAGRGFAVVASEVRALAQRSAEAAKEIKGLIAASTKEVDSGVVLVDKTGLALKDIVAKATEMDRLIHEISSTSQEQATSIAEINIAMKQMDSIVQQNAAMVEESTAAAHTLKGETQGLSAMVGRFQIGSAVSDGLRLRGVPSPRLLKASVR